MRDSIYREARAVSVKVLHVEGKVLEGATSVVLGVFLLVSASKQPALCSSPLTDALFSGIRPISTTFPILPSIPGIEPGTPQIGGSPPQFTESPLRLSAKR